MAMLDATAAIARLGNNVQDEIINQINRSLVIQNFVDVFPLNNKSIDWDVKFGTGLGTVKADGVDLVDGDFQNDSKVMASLPPGIYQDAFKIGGLARALSRVTSNPLGLKDIFGDELGDCAARIGKKINIDIYTGVSTSPQGLVGLSPASGTAGAIGLTGTYANIDRGTFPQWAASRNASGGIPRALTVELMRSLRESIYVASGEKPDLIICDAFQHRKLGGLTDPKRQFNDNIRMRGEQIKLDAGYNVLEFDGIPVVEDVDCPAGRMLFLNTRHMRLLQVQDMSDDVNGGRGTVLSDGTPEEQKGPAKRLVSLRLNPIAKLGDHIKFQLVGYLQLQVRRCNAFGQLVDLATS